MSLLIDLRITASGFDESVTRLYAPRSFGLLDHAQSNPIFHTPSSIKVFQFRIDSRLNPKATWKSIQAHEGRVANVLSD